MMDIRDRYYFQFAEVKGQNGNLLGLWSVPIAEAWEVVETEYADDEWCDDEVVYKDVWFPVRHEVCNVCNGTGKHVDPNVDRNGITEWHGIDRDDYMNGVYDVQCSCCKGKRVEVVLDMRRCTGEHKEYLRILKEHIEEERAYRSMCRSEMMGY